VIKSNKDTKIFYLFFCFLFFSNDRSNILGLALKAKNPPPYRNLLSHLAASGCCCRGIVTATVIATTLSNTSTATIAITAIDVVVFYSCEWWLILVNPKNGGSFKGFLLLRIIIRNCLYAMANNGQKLSLTTVSKNLNAKLIPAKGRRSKGSRKKEFALENF
jgi:hypothetical protein